MNSLEKAFSQKQERHRALFTMESLVAVEDVVDIVMCFLNELGDGIRWEQPMPRLPQLDQKLHFETSYLYSKPHGYNSDWKGNGIVVLGQ